MKVIILLGIFILPFVLEAQVVPNQQKPLYQNYPSPDERKTLYQKKVISFTKMKRTGIYLTFGGVALSVAGLAMMVNSGFDPYYYDPYFPSSDDGAGLYYFGYINAVTGFTAIGGGITFWVIGSSRVKSYKQKLNSVYLNLNPASRQIVSFTYRF